MTVVQQGFLPRWLAAHYEESVFLAKQKAERGWATESPGQNASLLGTSSHTFERSSCKINAGMSVRPEQKKA